MSMRVTRSAAKRKKESAEEKSKTCDCTWTGDKTALEELAQTTLNKLDLTTDTSMTYEQLLKLPTDTVQEEKHAEDMFWVHWVRGNPIIKALVDSIDKDQMSHPWLHYKHFSRSSNKRFGRMVMVGMRSTVWEWTCHFIHLGKPVKEAATDGYWSHYEEVFKKHGTDVVTTLNACLVRAYYDRSVVEFS